MIRQFGIFSESWVPVALERDIRELPVRVTVLGGPIVLWRTSSGQIAAIADRCPHRGARLSDGTVVDSGVRCPYHGWTFAPSGKCVHIPAPESFETNELASIPSFTVNVNLGIIWLSLEHNNIDHVRNLIGNSKVAQYAFTDIVRANLLDVAENLLDITHFPFVHERSFSEPSRVTNLDCFSISETNYGFECRYVVPVVGKGAFETLCPPETSSVSVRSLYIAPFTQLFFVVYDSGLSYSSIQTLCPIDDTTTGLFQAAFADELGDASQNQALRDSDFAIWSEDKNILESLQVPRLSVGWYESLKSPVPIPPAGLRRHVILAMGFDSQGV